VARRLLAAAAITRSAGGVAGDRSQPLALDAHPAALAPGGLGLVERLVCADGDDLGGLPGATVGDARRTGTPARHVAAQTFSDVFSAARIAIEQQQSELLSPEPGEDIAGAHEVAPAGGRLLEQPVARRVAEGVDVLLEMIEVDDRDRPRGSVLALARRARPITSRWISLVPSKIV
jgi:hypothetical protein